MTKWWKVWLAGASVSVVLMFAVGALVQALGSNYYDHDAFLFLGQSRRLTDPNFSNIGFVFSRSRSLVIVLVMFESLFKQLFSDFPGLIDYQILMVIISVTTLVVWLVVGNQLFGRPVGYLAAVFLSLHYLLIDQGRYVLADIFTGLLMGIFYLVFFEFLKRKTGSDHRKKGWIWCAVLLGIVGGLVSMGKYQFLFFVPACLVTFYIIYLKLPVFKTRQLGDLASWRHSLGIILLVAIVTVDIVQRLFGTFKEGLWFNIRLYLPYLQYLSPTGEFAPAHLYLADFYQAYGLLFCLLSLFSFAMTAIKLRHSGRLFLSHFEPWKKMGLLVFISTQLVFILFTQIIRHKEARYILPLLPMILLLIAASLVYVVRDWPKFARAIWAICWIGALAHPARVTARAHRAIQSMHAKPQVREIPFFFRYLAEPGPLGNVCETIWACRLNGPIGIDITTYAFFLGNKGVNTAVSMCRLTNPHADYFSFIQKLIWERSLESCYVLGNSFSEGKFTRATVLKTVSLGVGPTGVEQLRRNLPLQTNEQLRCKPNKEQSFDCFLMRDFFTGSDH